MSIGTQIARALAARRRTNVSGICAHCSEPFSGYVHQLYCSPKCASAASTKTWRSKQKRT